MRKYSIKKFFIVFVSMISAILLFSIISDRKPFEGSGLTLITGVLVAVLAYLITALLTPKEKLEKEVNEEKRRNDERYLLNKGKISYFFMVILAILIPFTLAFLNYDNVSVISIKSLAIIFVIVFLLYIIILQFYKKNKCFIRFKLLKIHALI
ncbi:Uncharacterised protein [Listeria ivanovii subsp. londoniensis]|uniref:DUF2178 domain-containing protein n=2 Tax=Listeria ivanovii TaxID=1638 RepID=A0ABS1G654_LISIV|nr:hypothetical protein [Listeria ivanovii]EFR95877.1 conserved hypothetical protein [Listeria ivanovii FSL F6-596]AIS60797.1 hypothetical protein JL58_12805 [Listeria ivanovii subsp. londoniensis]MBK1962230.1 hypothetical protein [Listeria ivanovii subsp. londoniensis]SDX05259.1 hypothetical protein SAMN05421782_11017 [Listeria ivanovii]VEH47912.1 Uncharacterised protein [Listeria ivanovii subsp. londoniensis]